jgi:hypothetical protein
MLFLTLGLFCAAVLAAFAPATWLGTVLHEALVEEPARLLNGSALSTLARIVALLFALAFAVGTPELVLLMGFADLALVMEVAAFVILTTSVVGLKAAGVAIRKAVASLVRRVGSVPRASPRARTHGRRARRPRPPMSGEDADGPAGWGHAWA